MNPATQLKSDLAMIGAAVKSDDAVPDSIKRHLGEIVAWNEAKLALTKDLGDRLEQTEAALRAIIEEEGELLSEESGATLMHTIEHAKLLCQATLALLEGPLAAHVDEMSKKRFKQLIETTLVSCATSTELVEDLVGEEVEDDNTTEAQIEEDEDGLGDDGDDAGTDDEEDEVDADD
jgi:hypothetical protein